MSRRSCRLACLALLCAALFNACDLLRLTPLCVVGWTPGDGFHLVGDASVSLSFNIEPDHASVEDSFALVCDGEAVAGLFDWNGRTADFIPLGTLKPNAEYRISVGADARTPRGFSMERAFESRFTTRPEFVRPSVVSTSPGRFGDLGGQYGTVEVLFSEAIAAVTFRDAMNLTPSIPGDWSLDTAGIKATFTPRESWRPGIMYRLDIAAGLTDACGNRMGQDYSTAFTAGLDAEPPALLTVEAVDRDGAAMMPLVIDDPYDTMVTDNHGIEASWDLRLRFNEPVLLRTLSSRLVCDGGPALLLQTAGETSEQALFHFEQRPGYGSRMQLRVRSGITDAVGNPTTGEEVWWMTVDGPASRPPRFVGIRLPLAPGAANEADRQLVSFGLDQPFATLALGGEPEQYPAGISTSLTIELYVELASGATFDLFSMMQSFGITATNGALEFQPLLVEPGGYAWAPAWEPWSNSAIVRVGGRLTNRVNTGVVTISLAAGCSDSLGNTTAEPQGLPLLK